MKVEEAENDELRPLHGLHAHPIFPWCILVQRRVFQPVLSYERGQYALDCKSLSKDLFVFGPGCHSHEDKQCLCSLHEILVDSVIRVRSTDVGM